MMPGDAGATLQRRGDCMLQASFLRRLSGRASDDVNVSLEGTKEVSWMVAADEPDTRHGGNLMRDSGYLLVKIANEVYAST